jgi:hypothetical protein
MSGGGGGGGGANSAAAMPEEEPAESELPEDLLTGEDPFENAADAIAKNEEAESDETAEGEQENPFAEEEAENPFGEEAKDSETENPFAEEEEDLFADEPETFGEEPVLPQEPAPQPQRPPVKEPSPDEKPLGEDSSINRKTLLELMSHLQEMAESLPKEKKEEFKKNPMRSTFEKVLDALRGKRGGLLGSSKDANVSGGFLAEAKKKMKKNRSDMKKQSGKRKPSGPFDDDPGLFTMLRQKAQSIMSRIKSVTDKRKK